MITRFGLQISQFSYPGIPNDRMFDLVKDIAIAAERAGFDSVWVMDDLHQIKGIGAPSEPILEAFTLLGALAATVPRVRLGAMFASVTYRNPALLAKIITTLDVISGGRAVLGIGEAWREEEHLGYGFDFPDDEERMARLEEAVVLCKTMLADGKSSYSGKYYHTDNALNFPRPITPGGPPVLIAGYSIPARWVSSGDTPMPARCSARSPRSARTSPGSPPSARRSGATRPRSRSTGWARPSSARTLRKPNAKVSNLPFAHELDQIAAAGVVIDNFAEVSA